MKKIIHNILNVLKRIKKNLNMNYVKNLIKILLFAQCFLLFCACNKKEVITTEQHKLNLADFVKCPFNEEFGENTNLEKYVLKKFGTPDSTRKWRSQIADHDERVADKIELMYENCEILIYRWVSKKRFEIFKGIFMLDYTDLKHGINKETTTKDIERIFGKPERAEKFQIEKNIAGSDADYYRL